MKPVFADAAYFLALINPTDRLHERAVEFNRDATRRLVTTEWVLTEVGDALHRGINRVRFGQLLQILTGSPHAEVINADSASYRRGCDLFLARADKEWSLTDCISIIVMQDRGLEEALTHDRHFEQAGFRISLKD